MRNSGDCLAQIARVPVKVERFQLFNPLRGHARLFVVSKEVVHSTLTLDPNGKALVLFIVGRHVGISVNF